MEKRPIAAPSGLRTSFPFPTATSQRRACCLWARMALHEEQERRALEGELWILEQAWKEAEEIAVIPLARRPDPAFRQMHPTDSGLVMIDDLGNAAGLGQIEAAALRYNRETFYKMHAYRDAIPDA